jgi:hypothetical protein
MGPRIVLAVFAAAAAAACESSPVAIADGDVTAVPGVYWSGNEVTLVSRWFVGADTAPPVSVGSTTLSVRRTGPESIAVTLPDSAGIVDLSVMLRGSVAVPVRVRVYGLVASREGPDVWGLPWSYSVSGEPTALIMTADGHLALANYRTGDVQLLTSSGGWVGCNMMPLPVPAIDDPTLVPLEQGCAAPVTYRAFPGPATAPDSAPPAGGWLVIRLRPGHWLINRKHEGFLLFRHAANPAGFDTTNFDPAGASVALGVALSPGRTRLVPTRYLDVGPIPVFDVAAETVAFRLPTHTDMGADFSPDGDTLFVFEPDTLVARQAADGVELGRGAVVSSAFALFDLLADPQGPWLYAGGAAPSGVELHVFDRATLAEVASMRVPPALVPPTNSGPYYAAYVLLLDSARRRLYLTMNRTVSPSHVFEFDLP